MKRNTLTNIKRTLPNIKRTLLSVFGHVKRWQVEDIVKTDKITEKKERGKEKILISLT
uniref:Uncharacterized protein n=1 Tax=Arion vulgaris TaxID=1028688 RepID=A0A0B7AKR4_9EUPU